MGVRDCRRVPVWIYALTDPRTHTIKYIGRTEDLKRRFQVHLAGGRSCRAVQRWVRELRYADLQPLLEELYVVSAGEDADDAEYQIIRAFRRRGAPLLNDFSVELRAKKRRDCVLAVAS